MGAHTQKGTMLCPMIILHKIQKIDVQHTSLPVSVVCPGSKTESMIVGSPFALDLLALCFLKCGLGISSIGLRAGNLLKVESKNPTSRIYILTRSLGLEKFKKMCS